jgi:hypothetical protein
MILSYGLFKWWIWVRDFGKSGGDLRKNLGLRLKMMKFQFGLSIYENYSLVPKLWKNYNGPWSIIRDSRQNREWFMSKLPV